MRSRRWLASFARWWILPVLVSLHLGCDEPRAAQSPASGSLKAVMRDHAVLGVKMRDAVARGDVAAANRAAQAMAALPSVGDLGSAQRARLEAIGVNARRASDAVDIRSAAAGLAEVAEACGECHATFGGPGVVTVAMPGEAPGVAARMGRHQWALARMWAGLVGPSDDAWLRGASALMDAPMEPVSLTAGRAPVPAIGELSKAVHQLGAKAATLPRAARADAYGELMATCGSCHTSLGVEMPKP